MIKKIELLAPGGDIDSIKAAIMAGADAIYCGLDKFNARNRAANISFDELLGVLKLAHNNNCEVFLTLNIIILDSEVPALIKLLNKLVNTSIDGVIIQDLGIFYLLANYFPRLIIHASTQLTTHNKGQIDFLSIINAKRVNLSRELNSKEIKTLSIHAHDNRLEIEVFVHGSYCISFSGLCYMSSLHSGNSGNRGRCSQPCRDKYVKTSAGKEFPLNMKDNSAFFDLQELADAGVDSLKIEGRIKKFDYVHTIVSSWRKQLDKFYRGTTLATDNSDLYKVFNRDFSNSFLKGSISNDLFIDSPRDHSVKHFTELNKYTTADALELGQLALYKEKEETKFTIENRIKALSIAKIPLKISVSGECGSPLKVWVETPETSFEVFSDNNLSDTGTEALNFSMLMKRLKALNDTEYYIEKLELDAIQGEVFIPFKELSLIKNRILFLLNGSKEMVEAIQLPNLPKPKLSKTKPTLSVLINAEADIEQCTKNDVAIYFQLPNSIKNQLAEYIDLFTKNDQLIPWFPSILIGDDFTHALYFIEKVQPKILVTNNTGIAFDAYKRGISWIAGPYLNMVNSYSLLCLKEQFNCSGAFISNELSKNQVQQIKTPENFNLYFSMYHPIALMTSRVCLFHQITGCKKNILNNTCIEECEKTAPLKDVKGNSSFIEKSKGNYHQIYNDFNYLNTEVSADFATKFSSFFIDLRSVKTSTKLNTDTSEIITLFKQHLNKGAEYALKKNIYPSTNIQYKKGI